VLTRDAWQCKACGAVCQEYAQADHVVPVSQGGARYDVANGQTLCRSCHGRKTRREQGEVASQNRVAVACASQVVASRPTASRDQGGRHHPNFGQ
jgi:5-methylcytosine-specific restriction endonuclease McrA